MSKNAPPRYFDSKGNPVYLGKRVGSGGEGDVFTITSPDPMSVAKIYKKPLGLEKQEKLRLMARGCNEDLQGIAAWPSDVLHARLNGPVCGFIMPRIDGCEPIHKVYGPSHRKERYPDADWRFLLRAAKNLSAAFDIIHAYGYVIGDVNEGNILVSDNACVHLIDCDSFQVRTETQIHYCEVGVAQFTPPEIQKSKDFRLLRTPNHDGFGLAILIFLLLFMGRHPYSGVYKGAEDMPIERAIVEYRFAFSRSAEAKKMAPPPNTVGLSIVPAEIASLFEQAFSETGAAPAGRPEPHIWWNALDTLEKQLRICTADSIHRYYSGLRACPWCELDKKSGIALFLSADSPSRIDITNEWRKIENVKPPGTLPAIGPKDYPAQPMPLNPEIYRALALAKFRHVIGLAVGGAGLVAGFIGSVDLLLVILFLVIAAIIGLFPGKEAKEIKRRKDRLKNARLNWALWNRKWKKEAGDEEFAALSSDLKLHKKDYEGVEREYREALASLRGPALRERQLKGYLDHCFIDNDPSIRISANQRAALRSFGIETAADLTIPRLDGISELNDAVRGELMLWRQKMESGFVFDPAKGTDRAAIQALQHTFQPRLNAGERDLRQGLERLCQVQQRILNNRAKFRSHVEKSAKELAQAQADITVFGTGLSRWF